MPYRSALPAAHSLCRAWADQRALSHLRQAMGRVVGPMEATRPPSCPVGGIVMVHHPAPYEESDPWACISPLPAWRAKAACLTKTLNILPHMHDRTSLGTHRRGQSCLQPVPCHQPMLGVGYRGPSTRSRQLRMLITSKRSPAKLISRAGHIPLARCCRKCSLISIHSMAPEESRMTSITGKP